jgi:MFS family permease
VSQFGLTNTLTSVLIVFELAGIAIGSLLSPFFSKGQKWYRVLVPAAFIMAVCMLTVAVVPFLPVYLRKATIIASLSTMGIAGGLFSVPLASFVQRRPSANIKGRIIAASMFADFSGIMFSGLVFYLLDDMLRVKPSNCYAVMAVMAALLAVWLLIVLPKINEEAKSD